MLTVRGHLCRAVFYGEGMLESALPVAFVPATDLGRAQDFYEGALGLPVLDVSGFACVFRAGPITLRVTLVGELAPPPFTVFGWEVAAIHDTVATWPAAAWRSSGTRAWTRTPRAFGPHPAVPRWPGSATRTATSFR